MKAVRFKMTHSTRPCRVHAASERWQCASQCTPRVPRERTWQLRATTSTRVRDVGKKQQENRLTWLWRWTCRRRATRSNPSVSVRVISSIGSPLVVCWFAALQQTMSACRVSTSCADRSNGARGAADRRPAVSRLRRLDCDVNVQEGYRVGVNSEETLSEDITQMPSISAFSARICILVRPRGPRLKCEGQVRSRNEPPCCADFSLAINSPPSCGFLARNKPPSVLLEIKL